MVGSEDCVVIEILRVDFFARRVTIVLRGAKRIAVPCYHPLFRRPGIRVERRANHGLSGADVVLDLDFSGLRPHNKYPHFYPLWREKTVFLPGWALLPLSKCTGQRRFRLIVGEGCCGIAGVPPSAFLSYTDITETWFAAGYHSCKVDQKGCEVKVVSSEEDIVYGVADILNGALAAVHNVFGSLNFPRLSFIVDQQYPVLDRDKASPLFGFDGFHGRYLLRTVADRTPETIAESADVLIHELMHQLVEINAPAGSWKVEGLVTYLTRRTLLAGGFYTPAQWDSVNRKALGQFMVNPLARKVSMAEAEEHFFTGKHYANLLYTKGHFITYLVDADGIVLNAAARLFRDVIVGQGRLISEREFDEALGEAANRKLTALLNKKDVTPDLIRLLNFTVR